MFVIYITLCMLDKFSYYVIFVMYIFNIKKILGASPVRLFGRDWSGFKLLQARNIFVSLSWQTVLLKFVCKGINSSRQS